MTRKFAKRSKQSKVVYVVPEGKFRESKTPGYDVEIHRKLLPNDFADPLHYAQWMVWYHSEFVKLWKTQVKAYSDMGSTSLERADSMEMIRLQQRMEALKKKLSIMKG